tara:strand:- start:73 stop:303 length:231 start_codon:yes stop_codon:yes gene_type:complete
MAKSPSKPKLDIVSDMFIEEPINGEYMFTNRKYNLQVYVDADGWREAEDKFATCQFKNPEEWEIYVKVRRNKDNAN